MSDFRPIGISLIIIILAGVIFPFILGFFMDIGDYPTSNLAEGLATFIEEGYEVEILGLSLNINPFGILPDVLEYHLSDSIKLMGILPDFILISALLYIFVALGYGIFRLIRG